MERVLITGATGTFGKSFIGLYANEKSINNIVLFSRDEFKQYNLKNELVEKYGNSFVESKFRFFLGDVRDQERLSQATKDVDVVVHAAALKHVPICEYNPSEALLTNVTGTKNVCDISIKNGVKKVVVLSTDKAVEPINFYGSTKILAEKYAVHSNLYSKKNTSISCVRYGNILGSRGSIVEAFKNQVKANKPFQITDYEMTRFWMHIDDSSKLVMWAIKNAVGGEVIVPKIKASKLVSIANAIDPNRPHKMVGIRPGEKIHEQLFSRREHLYSFETNECDYFVVTPDNSEFDYVRKNYLEKNWSPCKRDSYYSNDKDLQLSPKEIEEFVSFD